MPSRAHTFRTSLMRARLRSSFPLTAAPRVESLMHHLPSACGSLLFFFLAGVLLASSGCGSKGGHYDDLGDGSPVGDDGTGSSGGGSSTSGSGSSSSTTGSSSSSSTGSGSSSGSTSSSGASDPDGA